jgi:hypothetical protein
MVPKQGERGASRLSRPQSRKMCEKGVLSVLIPAGLHASDGEGPPKRHHTLVMRCRGFPGRRHEHLIMLPSTHRR